MIEHWRLADTSARALAGAGSWLVRQSMEARRAETREGLGRSEAETTARSRPSWAGRRPHSLTGLLPLPTHTSLSSGIAPERPFWRQPWMIFRKALRLGRVDEFG